MPTLYLGCDHDIELQDLRLVSTGVYLNAATVTVTLVDRDSGEPVAGATWPLTLEYVAGSQGTYRTVFPDSLTLTDGQRLQANVTADAGINQRRYWEIFVTARVDRS